MKTVFSVLHNCIFYYYMKTVFFHHMKTVTSKCIFQRIIYFEDTNQGEQPLQILMIHSLRISHHCLEMIFYSATKAILLQILLNK